MGRAVNYRLVKAIFKLKRLADGGYYHNVKLSERYSTYSIGGMRQNRPLNDPSYSEVLWGCIQRALGRELAGLHVVDIGPAEGYFALEAAKLGARVTLIHPPHYFIDRLKALAEYFKLEERIEVIAGYYPQVGREAVSKADIVLCLGLLYHLENLIDALRPMVESRATLVIEGIFFEAGSKADNSGHTGGFDPVRHRNNERICSRWLTDYLVKHRFKASWLEDWQKFVERPGNLRHVPTRKVVIATPQ